MIRALLASTCALTVISAPVAFAVDFTQADALFASRASGSAAIAAARERYGALLPAATQEEKIYAVEMMGRLDYYEGLIVSDTHLQEKIFEACLDRVEKHLPKTGVEYQYWKATCLASWARARGILQSLSRSAELVDLCNKGAAIDGTYEGGGFYRILAAAYSRLPPINPLGPTRNPEKALELADKAIASSAYAGAADPATATGNYFFNAYEYRAEALDALGRRSDAVATLKSAIRRIEAGDVAPDREPETQEQLKLLKTALSQLQ